MSSGTTKIGPTWIVVSKKLLKGTSLINKTPNEVLLYALTSVVTSGIVPEEDLMKFNATLQFNEEDLEYWKQSIVHIYKKSCAIVTKPASLQKDLVLHLKLHVDKAECFVKVWTEETKHKFGDLDKRKKLDDVSWALNLRLQSSHHPPGSKLLEGVARMHLNMSDFDGRNKEKCMLDLNFQDLKELYTTLEKIQENVDKFNARLN